jgi:hypothetical protein
MNKAQFFKLLAQASGFSPKALKSAGRHGWPLCFGSYHGARLFLFSSWHHEGWMVLAEQGPFSVPVPPASKKVWLRFLRTTRFLSQFH